MPSKALIVAITVAMIGVSTNAIARGGGGGGGGGGGKGGSGAHFGHAQFTHHQFNRFQRNNRVFGGSGWGLGGWGWPYGDGSYSNTNVIVYPQATPVFASGSLAATPCHWNEDVFKVPSSAGGTTPVSVVACH